MTRDAKDTSNSFEWWWKFGDAHVYCHSCSCIISVRQCTYTHLPSTWFYFLQWWWTVVCLHYFLCFISLIRHDHRYHGHRYIPKTHMCIYFHNHCLLFRMFAYATNCMCAVILYHHRMTTVSMCLLSLFSLFFISLRL